MCQGLWLRKRVSSGQFGQLWPICIQPKLLWKCDGKQLQAMFQYALSAPLPPHYQKPMTVLQCILRAAAPISSYNGWRPKPPTKKKPRYTSINDLEKMKMLPAFSLLIVPFSQILYTTSINISYSDLGYHSPYLLPGRHNSTVKSLM